jgi:hypothetical protein
MKGTMKRLVSTCAPDYECSYAEISAIVRELDDVRKDESIQRYDNPSISEMKEIINRSENYAGEWYHSEVILNMGKVDFSKSRKEKLVDSETEEEKLRDRIIKLGADHGLYLFFSYDSPELDAALKAEKVKFSKNGTSHLAK